MNKLKFTILISFFVLTFVGRLGAGSWLSQAYAASCDADINDEIVLNADCSSAENGCGGISSYDWTITDPSGSSSSASGKTTSFTPGTGQDGNWTADLTVTDGENRTSTVETATIHICCDGDGQCSGCNSCNSGHCSNTSPSASISVESSITYNACSSDSANVTCDGSDAEDSNSNLDFTITGDCSSSCTGCDGTSCNATIGSDGDTISATCQVTDSCGLTDSASDSSTASDGNDPPDADLGVSQDPVEAGELLIANASGSSDPEGDSLSYNFNGEVSYINNGDNVSTDPMPCSAAGTDVQYEVTVSDGPCSDYDSATTTVKPKDSPSDPNVSYTVSTPTNCTGSASVDASGSSDPDTCGGVDQYDYNVIGGPSCTGCGSSWTWNMAESHDQIEVTVHDTHGNTDSSTTSIDCNTCPTVNATDDTDPIPDPGHSAGGDSSLLKANQDDLEDGPGGVDCTWSGDKVSAGPSNSACNSSFSTTCADEGKTINHSVDVSDGECTVSDSETTDVCSIAPDSNSTYNSGDESYCTKNPSSPGWGSCSAIELDGTASDDGCGGTANCLTSYDWTVSRPEGGTDTYTGSTVSFTPTVCGDGADGTGHYDADLQVTDTNSSTNTSSVNDISVACYSPTAKLSRTFNDPRRGSFSDDARVGWSIDFDASASHDNDEGGKLNGSDAGVGATSKAYDWSIVLAPGASNRSLTSTSGPTTSFTPDKPGTYEVKVKVTDDEGQTDSTSTTFTIHNQQPTSVPVASGDTDGDGTNETASIDNGNYRLDGIQSTSAGCTQSTVDLDGTYSHDIDTTALKSHALGSNSTDRSNSGQYTADGDESLHNWQWTWVDCPQGLGSCPTIADPNSATTSFEVPYGDTSKDPDYELDLTVEDGSGKTHTKEINIEVADDAAAADLVVDEPINCENSWGYDSTATADASGSSDDFCNAIASYDYEVYTDSGTVRTSCNSCGETWDFTQKEIDDYVKLTVTDEAGNTSTDTYDIECNTCPTLNPDDNPDPIPDPAEPGGNTSELHANQDDLEDGPGGVTCDWSGPKATEGPSNSACDLTPGITTSCADEGKTFTHTVDVDDSQCEVTATENTQVCAISPNSDMSQSYPDSGTDYCTKNPSSPGWGSCDAIELDGSASDDGCGGTDSCLTNWDWTVDRPEGGSDEYDSEVQTFVPAECGTYSADLTVTDTNSDTDTTPHSDVAVNCYAPTAQIGITYNDPRTGAFPDDARSGWLIDFDASSSFDNDESGQLDGSGTGNGTVSKSYSWSLTTPGASDRSLNSTSGPTTSFTPDKPGTYEIQVTVTDDEGQTDTTTKTFQIHNQQPEAVPQARADIDGDSTNEKSNTTGGGDYTIGDVTIDDSTGNEARIDLHGQVFSHDVDTTIMKTGANNPDPSNSTDNSNSSSFYTDDSPTLDFDWSWVKCPQGIGSCPDIDDPSAATTHFKAPYGDEDQNPGYVLELTVTDDSGRQHSRNVKVNIDDNPPTPEAEADNNSGFSNLRDPLEDCVVYGPESDHDDYDSHCPTKLGTPADYSAEETVKTRTDVYVTARNTTDDASSYADLDIRWHWARTPQFPPPKLTAMSSGKDPLSWNSAADIGDITFNPKVEGLYKNQSAIPSNVNARAPYYELELEVRDQAGSKESPPNPPGYPTDRVVIKVDDTALFQMYYWEFTYGAGGLY